ncbi:MAG: peptidase T [Planctomycetes bacterium]|nr:peptidase T [Planctomycetota bacterium]
MNVLLDRFCRYVKVETTAVEQTDAYPSSAGQLELGKILAAELNELGLIDVRADEHGLVWGDIPATVAGAPRIAWFAHMDTSPEFTGKNVKPVIHENYDGKDIVLPGDSTRVIRVDDCDVLAGLIGKTIITSDGTTLLGADDKSGIAVIMTAADHLMKNRDIPCGPIRVLFTCDEEVGRGVDKLAIAQIDAVCGYTLDGETIGELDTETFSADLAVVTITGRNIHPGLATRKMVNAIRLASLFVSRMPWEVLSPENTSDREGFMHPYKIDGGVDRVEIRIILRSFETGELAKQADMLREMAATVLAAHPRAKIDVNVTKQYRNMGDALTKEPRAAELAAEAIRTVGLTPRVQSIRGGTDGSRLSELGLPTPNLAVGMHNFHSPLEFACLDEMEQSVDVLIELARIWGKQT